LGESVWTPPESFGSLYTPIQAAAFGFAAGDDKLGNPVEVEIVARAAKILALAENTEYLLPSLSGPVHYDASTPGSDKYINLTGFSGYDRANTFPGEICYFELDGGYTRESIIDAIFNGVSTAPIGNNIAGFAQAAEDARNVLTFTHDPSDVLGEPALLIWVDSVFENVVDLPCGE
ncbi:MAG: hypothetical protein KAR12_02105, partial [Methylococcales bacterium]|nr:hypothetical protein [Methylococcales bacterium]